MLTKTYALRCDDCARWSTSTGFANSKQARAHARSQGWKRLVFGRSQTQDLCPKCDLRARGVALNRR